MWQYGKLSFALCWVLCAAAISLSAQDEDDPKAFLRQELSTGQYQIEVYTNHQIAPPATGQLQKLPAVAAALSNKSETLTWEGEVKECGKAVGGKFCKDQDAAGLLRLHIVLATTPQLADKFKVSFAVLNDAGRGTFHTVAVEMFYQASGPIISSQCADGLLVTLVAAPPPNITPTMKAELDDRIVKINTWLKAQADPSRIAKLRVEPLTEADLIEPAITTFEPLPRNSKLLNIDGLDVGRAQASQSMSICLKLFRRLPTEKFNAEVVFQNDPPLELSRALVATLTGSKNEASPTASAVAEEDKFGLRTTEKNLDLGVVFSSSVKNEEEGGATVRRRKNNGVLDLRFAPVLRHRFRPPRVGVFQPFWTPIFLDGKVSTGKIDEDTLSLNRIIFGTEWTFRYVDRATRGKINRYVITLRGFNASDRDFKRAEAAGEIELRPIWAKLNRPLTAEKEPFPQILMPEGDPKIVPSPRVFGYRIEPFIGTQLGRIYRQRREALKGEELSRTVRRLFFGMDILLSVTPRFNLKLSDTFYIRGETPADRARNYFDGEVEAALGNLTPSTAQSVYFSWERGNQPPFATPDVNALKVGYRIRSNFFGNLGAP